MPAKQGDKDPTARTCWLTRTTEGKVLGGRVAIIGAAAGGISMLGNLVRSEASIVDSIVFDRPDVARRPTSVGFAERRSPIGAGEPRRADYEQERYFYDQRTSVARKGICWSLSDDQALSYAYPAALRAAAVLGVADHLVDRSKTADELAEAAGTDPLKLYRVLRLLASRGVFREDEQGRFALTPPAELLRADVPLSIQLPLLRPTTFADASFSPLAMDAPIMALNMDRQVGWADRRVSDDDY